MTTKPLAIDQFGVVAEAQGLGIDDSFARPPYAQPSLIRENVGASDRVVVDLGALRQQAAALVECMHAESFTGV